MRVTPTFSPDLPAAQRRGVICPRGEAVSVSATSFSSDATDAGTTKAGVHTFNYRFLSDPALVVRAGIEDALRRGGCRVGTPATASLSAVVEQIEARGLECGFTSCSGVASSVIDVKLADQSGKLILRDSVTSESAPDCGMTICNEREASEMANEVLSTGVSRVLDKFAGAIRKQVFSAAAASSGEAGPAQAQAGEQRPEEQQAH